MPGDPRMPFLLAFVLPYCDWTLQILCCEVDMLRSATPTTSENNNYVVGSTVLLDSLGGDFGAARGHCSSLVTQDDFM